MTQKDIERILGRMPPEDKVLNEEAKTSFYTKPENLEMAREIHEANKRLVDLALQADTKEDFLLCLDGINANVQRFPFKYPSALAGIIHEQGYLAPLKPRLAELGIKVRKKQ